MSRLPVSQRRTAGASQFPRASETKPGPRRPGLSGAEKSARPCGRFPPPGTDDARTRVLALWVGIGLVSLGDYHDARAFLCQALDLATASGNIRAVIATELNLGDAYRYAGEAETADVLYRKALNTARSRHPELVDFALQHFGKHLMEQGDLVPARAHLREAWRLRIAKGDTGLIESTQAALDRVELLIGQAATGTAAPAAGDAEATQWSKRWTS
ncbi:tetratricopeptide repeat protein [Kitasatospora sp. NPDC087315]|uniref:tetratricopeptide repeat protein n=1 Tax=Kitasatospora sp. NPDC087315 TaxID=3364069 RepID=UPI0038165E1E